MLGLQTSITRLTTSKANRAASPIKVTKRPNFMTDSMVEGGRYA
jgi:hypothetical protein